IRRINHGRPFPIAERSPAQGRDIGDELVESWINEIDKLQLKDWAFAVEAKQQATPRMVDSARGELKTWFGNSVESFCVRRNTPPFGSSMSSPKRIRRASSSKPTRNVLFTVSPIRYFPGGRISLSIFGGGLVTLVRSSLGDGFSAFSASAYSRRTGSLI